mgnify:FL=1
METGTADIASVVIDNGSGFCKAGVAGEEVPKSVFRTVVGQAKGIMIGGMKEYFIGEETKGKNATLALIYPIENGLITNWAHIEKIWNHCYYDELKIAPEDQPCFLTAAPLTPKADKEKMAEIIFEKFNVPQFYIGNQAVLSLYASGRTTGLVLACGDHVSYAAPVSEGNPLDQATQSIKLAGRDLTEYFLKVIQDTDCNLPTFTIREAAQDLKEKSSLVALEYDPSKKEASQDYDYQLPDGKSITVGSQRLTGPEILFNPKLISKDGPGIHELAVDSIMKCDVDLRGELYQNICLAGGTAMITRLPERLTKEITSLAPSDMKVQVVAPAERRFSSWIGASILSKLSTWQTKWIDREEYEEVGPSIVHKKC